MLLFCLHMKEKSPVFTISYIISSASLYRSSQLSSSLVRQIPLILFFKPYFSSLFITLQAYFEQSVFAYLSWREATSTEIGSRGQCCALKANWFPTSTHYFLCSSTFIHCICETFAHCITQVLFWRSFP